MTIRDQARELQSKLQAISKQRYTSQVAHALVSIGLGELDGAMQWLQQAFQAHDALLCYAKVFPPYDALREQPRFQEMIRDMGVAGPFTSDNNAPDLARKAESKSSSNRQ